MLDTLLLVEREGLIDHAGICEEVDTFMFEGFDTTSMGLIFTLMNLALYPDKQQKCFEEIEEHIQGENLQRYFLGFFKLTCLVFPDELLDQLDINTLSKLKYLECCIKESLRLYPSVPIIARQAGQEIVLDNLILPANCQISIHIFDIHRDPKHFPNPHNFEPERFLPENSIGRHPFAFLPFSAGQRNCIGKEKHLVA